jgi:hypothetical protein
MSWAFTRDIGLMIFALGAVLFFGWSRIRSRVPELQLLDPLWIRTIGDGMMLGGACLALLAMFGHWAVSGSP